MFTHTHVPSMQYLKHSILPIYIDKHQSFATSSLFLQSRPVHRGGFGWYVLNLEFRPASKLVVIYSSPLHRFRSGGVSHKREHMCDFIAGLFPGLQVHELGRRHGATQPPTLMFDKHGNKSFAQQLERNLDVLNLYLALVFSCSLLHILLKGIILILITIIK